MNELRKYILLYNPISGGGKGKKRVAKVISCFSKYGIKIDTYESKEKGDFLIKAGEFASLYDYIITIGGDGTINEVITGIMGQSKRPVVAVLRGGTANDIAGMLKIPNSIKKAVHLIVNSKPCYTDINKINDRYFAYVAGTGIFTKLTYEISRKTLKNFGYLAYIFEAAKDLFNDFISNKYNFTTVVEYDSGVISGKFMLILILSSRKVGGLNLEKFSKSKLNDGLLDMRLFSSVKFGKIFRLFKFVITSGRKNIPDYHITSSKFKVSVAEDISWNVDGEFANKGTVDIEVIKEAIPFIVSDKSRKKYY
ncbi:MAG: diacylglycerol kinase family lipid kinase [Acholeplasmatales bacterium]|jgi:diacylglycerol kinase (ATP)|nr:diacylglycerol kinase family lipid kinase [Acholeplasmatales bacterium]